MFLCKKEKPPKIKFIPKLKGLKELVPIVPAKEFLPKWWKNINFNEGVTMIGNTPVNNGTVKRCPGIIDFLNQGWVVPLWSDLYLNVKGNESISFEFSDKNYEATIHKHQQLLDYVPTHIQEEYKWVLKLHSPWFLETPPGYSIYEMNPYYYFVKEFDTASGLTDSDIYHSINPFLFLKKDGEFIIKRGTPVSVIIPIKRVKIEGVVEDYNRERWDTLEQKTGRLAASKFSSIFSYKKEQRKCHFS